MAINDTVYSVESSAQRRANTFLRLTFSNTTLSNAVGLASVQFYNTSGALINAATVGVNASSTDVAANLIGPVSGAGEWRTSSGPGWYEIVIPGTQKLSSYKVTAAAGEPGLIGAFRLERLAPDNTQWQVLDIGQVPSGSSFAATRNGVSIPLLLDVIGTSTVPTNYSPVYDYTGMMPTTPTSVRASVNTKTSVTVKWTGNSSDTRATNYVIQRRDSTNPTPTPWAIIATVMHTETSSTSSTGVVTVKIKNITTYDDTIPETSTPHTYDYCVKAVNTVGESAFSDFGSVTSLTDDEVYVMSLNDKVTNNLPLTLTESCSLILNSGTDGAAAATMIQNKTGTYTNFKAAGYGSSACMNLAILALCMRDSNSLLAEQFARAQSALSSNVTANADFMTWAKDHLSFNINDMLSAADTSTEKQAIIDWMKTHGYLTV